MKITKLLYLLMKLLDVTEFIKIFKTEISKKYKLDIKTNLSSELFIETFSFNNWDFYLILSEKTSLLQYYIDTNFLKDSFYLTNEKNFLIFSNEETNYVYEVKYSEIDFIKFEIDIEKSKLMSNYIFRYFNVPLFKQLKYKQNSYNEELKRKIIDHICDVNHEVLLFLSREIWDMKICNDDFLNNTMNYLVIYCSSDIIGINLTKYTSIVSRYEEGINIRESNMKFTRFVRKYTSCNFFYIDYILHILRNSLIINTAFSNILKERSKESYIIFLYSLYFCEIIDQSELLDLQKNVKSNVNLTKSILVRLFDQDTWFKHKYGRLLRYVLYIEINNIWKKFLLEDETKNYPAFFIDTKILLLRAKNLKYYLDEDDLAEAFEKYIINMEEVEMLVEKYDSNLGNFLSDSMINLKKSLVV